MASQIQHRLDKRQKQGLVKRVNSLDWENLLLRPLPPLPEDAPFDPDLVAESLEELHTNPMKV